MTPEQQDYVDYVEPFILSVMRGGNVRYDTSDPNNVYVYIEHPDVPITTQGYPEMLIDMALLGVSFFPGMLVSLIDPVSVRRAVAHPLVDEICATPHTAFVGSLRGRPATRVTLRA